MTTTALNATQLANYRAANRWRRYFLAVSVPPSVYTARVNGTPATLDGVTSIPFDGGSGTIANVKAGMTCYIGSAAGAADRGMVRVRAGLSATPLLIGAVSGLQIADNDYLTIVEDFGLWPKEPAFTGGKLLMDTDTAWTSVTARTPIVYAGPPASVLVLSGATVAHTVPITIWSPVVESGGSMTNEISSYQHYAPGASATANMTSASPTITYNAAGEYYERFTATTQEGAVGTAYRKVFVVTAASSYPLVSPPDVSGDVDSGGWEFSVTGYSGVGITALKDRALCVLYSQDYVGTASAAGMGFYSAALNVRAVGWLDGETLRIETDRNESEAAFTVRGPAAWLDKMTGAPITLTDTATPRAWGDVDNLTTDRAIYHLAKWHSTLAEVCDVNMTGDYTRIKDAVINSGSVRSQIDGVAYDRILAALVFDRLACGWVFKSPSVMTATEYAAVPVLLDLTTADWETIEIERATSGPAAMVEIAAEIWDGTSITNVYSRAPGNIAARYGDMSSGAGLLAVTTQTEANEAAGRVYGVENNEYPSVDLTLVNCLDYLDIAPAQVVRLSLAAGDNPRGIAWTTKRLIPQSIGYVNGPDGSGAVSMDVNFTAETRGAAGVTYFPPPVSAAGISKTPDIKPLKLVGLGDWYSDENPNGPSGTCYDVANQYALTWDKWQINGTDTKRISRAYFPCKIRAASFANDSNLEIPIRWANDVLAGVADAQAAFHCYAIDTSGARVLTGTVSAGANIFSPTIVTFAPISATDVAGFEIELDAGAGVLDPTEFELGSQISTGALTGTDTAGVVLSGLTIGNAYAIQGAAGPFTPPPASPLVTNSYRFRVSLDGSNNSASSHAGVIGNATVDGAPLFRVIPPLGSSSVLAISENYGRVYWVAASTSVRAYFSGVAASTGTLDYVLFDATAVSTRTIQIGGSLVKNICEVG